MNKSVKYFMKKITINSYTRADKKSIYTKDRMYRVILGNGITAFFGDLIATKKFLAETNRFLNQKLHEINHLFIEVMGLAHSTWFILNEQQERIIDEESQAFARSRSLAVHRSSWENGNHFTWFHIQNCLENQERIIRILESFNRDTGRYNENYLIRSIKDRINYIKRDLSNFGEEYQWEKENGSIFHDDPGMIQS